MTDQQPTPEQETKADKVDWFGGLIPDVKYRKTPAGHRIECGKFAIEGMSMWGQRSGIPWFLIAAMSSDAGGFAIGFALAGYSIGFTYGEPPLIR